MKNLSACGLALLIIGCDNSEPPEPPTPAPPPAARTERLEGRLHGFPFVPDRAEYREGILTFSQGDATLPQLELTLYLFLPRRESPRGKSFRIVKGLSYQIPHLQVTWREGGKIVSERFTADYSLDLRFDEARTGNLTGKIVASLPDPEGSFLEGLFEAEFVGFRLVEGKPDLTADSIEILKYLAEVHLEEENLGKKVEIVRTLDARYSHSKEGQDWQEGYQEVRYRLGEGREQGVRLKYVKESGEWRVWRVIEKTEVEQAHPYKIPGDDAAAWIRFPYLAAKRLESELAREFTGRRIYGVTLTPEFSDGAGMGWCIVAYRVDGVEASRVKRYLFLKKDETWRLERELEFNETINYKERRIERIR